MTRRVKLAFTVALCLAALMAAQISGFATTYYVSPTGNDTTGNGSVGSPWFTLQRANQSASAGDLILAQPGTYNYSSTNTLSTSGSSGSYITYAANGAVTLNFTNSGADGIDVTGSYVIIDGFNITGVASPYTIYISNASYVQVRACNIVPHMMVSNANHILIHWNVFTPRTGVHGLYIGGSSNYVSVYSNTFYGITSGYGTWFNTSSSLGNEVVDCIFKNCWTGIYNTQGLIDAAHNYNMFHGMTTGAFYNLTAQSNEYTNTDPLLNNPGSGDYSLQSNSPARDYGRFVGWTYNGAAPDLGARESTGERSITAETISGTVRNALTSSAISGVSVSAWGSSGATTFCSTVTDANGYYSLTVPSCAQTIQLSNSGYLTQTKALTTPDSNVNVNMMPGYYVATNGNDTTGDGSQWYPWYTLGRASQSATAGCTIVVGSGSYTYSSTNTLSSSGNSGNRITYRADGDVTLNFTNSGGTGLSISGSYLVIDGFDITTSVASYPIYISNASYVDVRNCYITPLMYVTGSSNIDIRKNVFGPRTGVHGLYIAGNSSNVSVLNDTFYGITDGYVIWFNSSSSSGNQVLNCILKNCYAGIVNYQGLADSNHNHNMFHGMSWGALYNLTQQWGEYLNTDPLFVNAGSSDFHLQSNSPAINVGYDYGVWYGEGAPDYGAYETNPFMLRTAAWWNPSESWDMFDTAKWADDVYSMACAGLNGAWLPCFPYTLRSVSWGQLPTGDWDEDELAKVTGNVAYSDSIGQKTIIGLPYHTSDYPEHWLRASNFAYMLEIFDRIAKDTAQYEGHVAYAFCDESVNCPWYLYPYNYTVLVNHFRDWCWNQNTSISYWNTRWSTSYTWYTMVPTGFGGAGNRGIDSTLWMYSLLRPLLVEVADHIKAYAPNAPLGYHEWLFDSRITDPATYGNYYPVAQTSKYDFVSANLYGGTTAEQSKVSMLQSMYPNYPIFACELGTATADEPSTMKTWLDGQKIGYNWWCWYTSPGEPQFGLVGVSGDRRTTFPLLPNAANYGTVRGTVHNSAGAPIYYADVQGKIGTTVHGSVKSHYRAQSYSDQSGYTWDGIYRMDLSAGTYTVVVSSPGYYTQTINNVVVTAGQDTTLNVTLTQ